MVVVAVVDAAVVDDDNNRGGVDDDSGGDDGDDDDEGDDDDGIHDTGNAIDSAITAVGVDAFTDDVCDITNVDPNAEAGIIIDADGDTGLCADFGDVVLTFLLIKELKSLLVVVAVVK